MNSLYEHIIPQSERLQSLIKLYYLHRSDDEQAVERITYFPNYSTTINAYENSQVSWDLYSRTHERSLSNRYLKLLVGKFDKSREIVLKGPYNKLSMVFHPLGLNHFLDIPCSHIIEPHFSFFDYFGESFDRMLAQAFAADKIEAKRDLLDQYFESHYVGFQEHRLSLAIKEMFDSGGNCSIQEIAASMGISRKTLQRIFKTHLGYSPVEYKSIIKFRRALDLYQGQMNQNNLSSLAYEANFYDQSDLNAHFKIRTGLTPKQLFSEIDTIAKGLYWKVAYVPKVQDIPPST